MSYLTSYNLFRFLTCTHGTIVYLDFNTFHKQAWPIYLVSSPVTGSYTYYTYRFLPHSALYFTKYPIPCLHCFAQSLPFVRNALYSFSIHVSRPAHIIASWRCIHIAHGTHFSIICASLAQLNQLYSSYCVTYNWLYIWFPYHFVTS